jgi:hypothetical protein
LNPHRANEVLERDREVERLRAAMERDGYPRLRMFLLVALTGGCGFLASYVLLQLGVDSMALRYPLALCAAYAAFLLLLWGWLRSRHDHSVDAPDIDTGHAWQFPERSGSGSSPTGSGGGHGDLGGSFDFGDEFAIPLLVVLFVAVVACASLWVVYMAPALFAELLFDGILAAGLYRRVRHSDRRHWLETAVRRTLAPFALTLVGLIVFGVAAHAWVPGAHTLGDVVHRDRLAQDAAP